MLALLLAAQVAAAPAPDIQVLRGDDARRAAATVCKGQGVIQTLDPASPALLYRPQDRPRTRVSRLADLPKPNKEKAVLRSIQGCAAPLIVQFNVGP